MPLASNTVDARGVPAHLCTDRARYLSIRGDFEMSLQGTFNTSVQALNSQAQNLSNIATNIANVNTTAYKLQGSHFATLLITLLH